MAIITIEVQILFMQVANLDKQFPGFSLSIFDIPSNAVSITICIEVTIINFDLKEYDGQRARQLVRQVRAINYTVNLQDFTIVMICSLESLGDCKNFLSDGESTVDLGASIFQESSKASGMHNRIIRDH